MMRSILLFMLTVCFLASCGDNEAPVSVSPVPTDVKTMDSISLQIEKARSFQEKGQYAEALAITDAMLQRFPGQLDALSIKAEIAKDQGKPQEALAILEKAYSFGPRDKETAYNLAYEYADAKSPKALSLTDTLIKYDKTQTVARAWYVKATYYLNTGNPKEALRYYDSSILANHNFSDAYYDKGKLLFQQKKYEGALKTFALGQKFDPANALFYLWVAKTQEVMGNKTDAKTNYERAYTLDPSLTEAKESAEKINL